MYKAILAVHVTTCVLLIVTVLIQPSKGGGFAIFGGGGETLFSSSSGTSFLKKLTGWLAATFACTSLFLTFLSTRVGLHSVTMQEPERPIAAPATPAPAEAPKAESEQK